MLLAATIMKRCVNARLAYPVPTACAQDPAYTIAGQSSVWPTAEGLCGKGWTAGASATSDGGYASGSSTCTEGAGCLTDELQF